MQNPQGQAHHLQILASGRSRYVSWLRPHIVDDALLQPWNQEVRALVHNCILHPGKTVEDHGSSATFNIVDGSLYKAGAKECWDGPSVDRLECVCHTDSFEINPKLCGEDRKLVLKS